MYLVNLELLLLSPARLGTPTGRRALPRPRLEQIVEADIVAQSLWGLLR